MSPPPMVKASVPPIAAAITLLHTLGRHRAAQIGPAPGPKLDTFYAHAAMELPAARHVKVAARVVHDSAAVLVVGRTGLVHVRARDRLGCALEPAVIPREHAVHALALVSQPDSLLQ
jgi:hypothetical protein